jgi:hypothetical protein
MADSTTTGSTVIGGILPGMAKELKGYAGSAYFCETIISVYGNPNNVVTAQVGSQVVHDVENLNFYMATAANGSSWSVMSV